MPKLYNHGRLYHAPRGAMENWPTGEERDVSDEVAARLLSSGQFSVVAAPLVQTAPVVVPVTKAAAKKKRRPRKKA